MKKIKRFFVSMLIGLAGLIALVALSLHGERDYLENCKNLAINCEAGSIHKVSEKFLQWLEENWSHIKKNFSVP